MRLPNKSWNFPETYAVGAQFGVVLVPAPRETCQRSLYANSSKSHAVEVATFRSDIGYSDGRHPDEVRFSRDPREDVARRDFTINGMLLDPVTAKCSISWAGARIWKRESFALSAIRNSVSGKTSCACCARCASRRASNTRSSRPRLRRCGNWRNRSQVVSRERVRDELTRMLTEGHARRAFLLLDESGLLHPVLPEISAMKGVQQPPEYHPEGDVFMHTLLLLENLPHPCPLTLAWGALLHDVGKPATFRVAPDRIRFDDHVESE